MEKKINLAEAFATPKQKIIKTTFHVDGEEPKVYDMEVEVPNFALLVIAAKMSAEMGISSAGEKGELIGFAEEVVAEFCTFVVVTEMLTDVSLPDSLDGQWDIYRTSDLSQVLKDTLGGCYDMIVKSVKTTLKVHSANGFKNGESSAVEKALSALIETFNEKVNDVSFDELTKMLGGTARVQGAVEE